MLSIRHELVYRTFLFNISCDHAWIALTTEHEGLFCDKELFFIWIFSFLLLEL